MRQLGLIQDGRLTVAALLLFGRNPQRLLTQAMVRCARFKGTNEVHFLDMKVIQGNIIEQVEEVMAFIKRNIPMGAEIKGLRREDKWEYPLEGMREAVVNAVCHRDYASTANVQIRIFDDRLEVWNPGELPEGMTVEDLRRPHESKPRNRLIANAFFLIKYIEQFGTGIQRILDDCHAQELPLPTFEAKSGRFRAIFLTAKKAGKVTPVLDLNERQKRAVLAFKRVGRITRSEYEKIAGVSRATAKRDLETLKNAGVLVQRESGRAVYYEVAVTAGETPLSRK